MRSCLLESQSCVPGGKLGDLRGQTNSVSISAEVPLQRSKRFSYRAYSRQAKSIAVLLALGMPVPAFLSSLGVNLKLCYVSEPANDMKYK